MRLGAHVGPPQLFVQRKPVAIHLGLAFMATVRGTGKLIVRVRLHLGLGPRNYEA